MTETNQGFEQSLNKWLLSQGYPLEMSVAEKLRANGFAVSQSTYYLDPDKSTPREIDVLGLRETQVGRYVVQLALVIECKTSREKPWVLFTSPSNIADFDHVSRRITTRRGKRVLADMARDSDAASLGLFSVGKRPAYGLTQSFTSGTDVAYAAIMTATKAAMALARAVDANRSGRCVIAFPVIVIAAPLFEYFLDVDSQLILSPVDQGVIISRNTVGSEPIAIVNIVTADAINEFAAAAGRDMDMLMARIADVSLDAFLDIPSLRSRTRRPGWVSDW